MALTHAERNRRYYLSHPEEIRAYNVVYAPVAREGLLKKKYGLTLAEYDELLTSQGGKCAVCGADNSGCSNKDGTYQPMYVDHDHKTGKVRGLLCSRCNTALGYVHDDPGILIKLAAYLNHG